MPRNKNPILFQPTRIDGELGGVLNCVFIDARQTDESDVRALALELIATGKYRVDVRQWDDTAEAYSDWVLTLA